MHNGVTQGVKCDASDATQKGWTIEGAAFKRAGLCLDASSSKSELRMMKCDGSAGQKFTADPSTPGRYKNGKGCLDIFGSATCKPVVDRRVDLYACNGGANQLFALAGGVIQSKCGECLAVHAAPPSGGHGGDTTASQLWAKPLEKGAVAALFINGGATNRSTSIHLSELNITAASATVTDVWSGKQLGKTNGGLFQTPLIGPTDSAFMIFQPAA
jgi:hypothetical protein